MPSTVAHAEVESGPDGTLLVSWRVEGDPVAVDVASGPTADHLDHRHETTVPADTGTLELAPRARRHFVSVAPHGGGPAVVVGERRIPFRGITNFRDLGGYRTAEGGRVRWGLVFRADSLHGLSEEDLELYRGLGLRSVYDLRGEQERDERPNPVPSRLHTIVGRPAEAPPPEPPPGATVADGEQILRDLYVGLIDHAATRIGELYTGLAGQGGLPAVFHCHAGKDRTGIVAALLLEALGVGRAVVLDDYELTARYRLRTQQESSFRRMVEAGLTPEAAAGVLGTPRWAMEQALAHLDEHHGGVGRYLTGPAGMTPATLGRLRAVLVDPATRRPDG